MPADSSSTDASTEGTSGSSTASIEGPLAGRASQFSLDVEEQSLLGALRGYVGRVRSGDPGALPSVLGVLLLVVIFSSLNDRFLTRFNIGTLPGQGAYIAILGMGLIFVLLLGEIDLSTGTMGAMAAGFTGRAIFTGDLHHAVPGFLWWSLLAFLVLMAAIGVWLKTYVGAALCLIGLVIVISGVSQHVGPAMILAICIGAAAGIFNGFMVAKIGIPSFVATLALFLAWQGVLIFVLGTGSDGGSVSTTSINFWFNLTSKTLSPLQSWVFVVVLLVLFATYALLRSVRAAAAGLAHDALTLVATRVGVVAVVAIIVTVLANQNRSTNQYVVIEGIPWSAAFVVVLMVLSGLALTKTAWGRHLYAVGGNEEAARRAGIDVTRIKMSAFMLCSAFGGLGGLFLASTSQSVSRDLGGGNTLLFAVAAAVIGGTSLFGGRGRPSNAVIGALVIVIIPDGLGLQQNLGPQYQYVITGIVLAAAAAVDALSRRSAVRR